MHPQQAVPQHDTRKTAPRVVRAWTAADRGAWDDYVRTHPRATFFHQSRWKSVLEETFGYEPRYLVLEEGRSLRGVLPLFRCRSIRGRHGLFSLPHTVYGGPVGDDAAAERALVVAAEEAGTQLELRNRYPNALDLPAMPGFVTFEKELPKDVAQVYRTFPKKAREAINQATKRWKLEADFAGDLDTFYDLLAASYLALGTPVFPKRFFASILRHFPEETSILIVRHDGRPVACVFSVIWRGIMMPLYSGEIGEATRVKANNFKYYRLMERATELGLQRFDFGRSRLSNEGVVRFKTNQGFTAEPLPYQIVGEGAAVPSADPNRGFFSRARRVWRRLPAPVARRLGPGIIRYFP